MENNRVIYYEALQKKMRELQTDVEAIANKQDDGEACSVKDSKAIALNTIKYLKGQLNAFEYCVKKEPIKFFKDEQ